MTIGNGSHLEEVIVGTRERKEVRDTLSSADFVHKEVFKRAQLFSMFLTIYSVVHRIVVTDGNRRQLCQRLKRMLFLLP